MKAYWIVDATLIQMFDSVDKAIETLDKMPDVFSIKHGDKDIEINKNEVNIEIEG